MASYQPYNITLLDDEPMFNYLPRRDGPPTSSWYLNWTGAIEQQWYTTDLFGASVQIEWIGTAIWLYGTGEVGGYTTTTDTSPHAINAGGSSYYGLLYSETGLNYGSHWVNVTVGEGTLTVLSAMITVGMGEVNSTLQNRTISMTNGSAVNTPFFSLSSTSDWNVTANIGPARALQTNAQSANLVFNLNSTVAFAMYGIQGSNAGLYSILVDPPPPYSGGSYQYTYDAYMPVPENQGRMALVTGLDRTQNYRVTVINEESTTLTLQSLLAFDALPGPTSSSSTSSVSHSSTGTSGASAQANASTGSHGLSAGGIAGVAVAGAIVLLVGLIALLVFLRRRQRDRYAVELDGPILDGDDTAVPYPSNGIFVYQSVARPSSQDEGPPGPAVHVPYTKSYTELPAPSSGEASGSSSATSFPETKQHVSSPLTLPSIVAQSSASGSTSAAGEIQEQDAGRIPPTQPPQYDPAWVDGRS